MRPPPSPPGTLNSEWGYQLYLPPYNTTYTFGYRALTWEQANADCATAGPGGQLATFPSPGSWAQVLEQVVQQVGWVGYLTCRPTRSPRRTCLWPPP